MNTFDKPPAPSGCQERRPSLVNIEGRAAKHILLCQPLIGASLEAELGDTSSPGRMEILVGSAQPPSLPTPCYQNSSFPYTSLQPFSHDEGSISMPAFPPVYLCGMLPWLFSDNSKLAVSTQPPAGFASCHTCPRQG